MRLTLYVLYGIGLLLWVPLMFFAFMLVDAPGSEESLFTLGTF